MINFLLRETRKIFVCDGRWPTRTRVGFLLHGCRASGFVLHGTGCRVKQMAILLHETGCRVKKGVFLLYEDGGYRLI